MTKQLYLPDTAILVTRFMTEAGVGEVRRLHAGRRRARRPTGTAWCACVPVVRGTMTFVLDIEPRFDYGRAQHTLDVTENGAVFRSDDMDLTLHAHRPRRDARQPRDLGLTSRAHGDGSCVAGRCAKARSAA